MPSQAPTVKTPGAKRAAKGEHHFDLAKLGKVQGGPDYTTATGACVEGDRMIVALMHMPAGTRSEPHWHPNEQWIFVVEGTFRAKIGEQEVEAFPRSVLYIPANLVHSMTVAPEADGLFFTVKDASYGLQGIRAS